MVLTSGGLFISYTTSASEYNWLCFPDVRVIDIKMRCCYCKAGIACVLYVDLIYFVELL